METTNNNKEEKEIIKFDNNEYIFLHYIDEGTYGKIYKVKNNKDKKEYALKTLKDDKINDIEIKEIYNEYDILRYLSKIKYNYYTPKVYDYSDKIKLKIFGKPRPGFILDYCEKGDLYHFIEENKGIKERYAKYIFKIIAEGINFCHKNNIIHFDIKVENILLDKDYNPIIIDFGLAEKGPNKRDKKDFKGKKGTTYAMCPQMFEENKGYSGIEADIFSLGILLFELVLKKMAFYLEYSEENYVNIKNKKYDKFWEKYDNGLSDEFKILYQKMVAYEPGERPDIENIILKDPWLKEINDLKDNNNQKEKYINEYKKYMSDIYKKIYNPNETIEESLEEDELTKSVPSENDLTFFNSELSPKNLSKEEIHFKYFIKMKLYMNANEFMNKLGKMLYFKYGEYVVDRSENHLKLKLNFENCKINITLYKIINEDEKNIYYIQFKRKESNMKNFYENFLEIKEIIRKILSKKV